MKQKSICLKGFIERIKHVVDKQVVVGFGLSIANYIVEAHKGTIKADHNKPKGTVITIKLPK